jgi:hypothetical protein
MNIIKDWVIITVPRVGSHYLQERIFVHTDKALVLKYHEPIIQKWGYATSKFIDQEKHWWSGLDTDNLKVITIARDPKDLLVSDIAMGINQELNRKEESTPELRDTYLQFYRYNFEEKKLKNRVDKYTNDYLKLESLSSIVIDYDDLVSFPFEVTCFITDRMGIEIKTDQYQKTNLDKNKYLVSSKNIPEYDVAKEIVNDLDLSNFYEAYDKIRSKCISL